MTDIFLARFTTAGVYSWAKRLGSATDNEAGYAAAMDTSGNVIITGYAVQPVDFGGGTLSALGNTDAFVAKYAATSGAHMWSRRLGGGGYDYGYGVTVDAANNVYVVGSFDGPANFGGISLTPAGFSDGFVAKYTSTGALQWVKALGGSGSDVARGVGIAGGSPVATGYFYATGYFDGATLTSAGGADAFVTKLNP
jgi:hypothetical protein